MTPRLRLLIQVALAAAVLFAGDFVWRMTQPDVAAPVQMKTAPRVAKPAAPAAVSPTAWRAVKPVTEYRNAFEAPLFAPDRNAPPPPQAVEVEAPPPPPPDPLDTARLIGVAAQEKSKLALIQSSGSVLRLEVGDTLGDWTVTAIDGNKVTFSKDGQTRDLVLPR